MRTILLAILVPTTLLFACGTSAPEGGDPEHIGEVRAEIYKGDSTDDTVIARARYWYDQGQAGHMGDYTNSYCSITGLNPNDTKDGSCHRDMEGNGVFPNTHFYRRDCSGMASMALHMGFSTNTAGFRDGNFDFERLGDDENAKPGDLVLTTAASGAASKFGNHTIIFEKWISGTEWKGYSGGSMPPRHNTYAVSKVNGNITNMDRNDGRVFHAWRSPHVIHGGPSCTAKTCSKLGLACGKVDKDANCGTALNCGGCGNGETCDNGDCQPTVSDAYAKSWWAGKLRNGGKCAELSGSAPIEMSACDSNALNQDWHLTVNRFLKSDKTDKCLQPDAIADGSVTRQMDCGDDDQIWRFRHMEIVNGQTGYCLDVPMADYHVGQRVIQWPCHGADNQRYKYMPQTGELKIAGYCLDAGSAANGAKVTLQNCDGSLAQQWNDEHGGFVNAAKPRCLALDGGDANASLLVSNCADTAEQMWALRGPIEHRDDQFCLKHAANGRLVLAECVEGQSAQTFTFWMNP